MRAKEICQLRAVLQPDHMTLCGIEKRPRPQVNEPRPALTMAVAEWNAGYREALVRIRTKIGREQTNRVGHFPAHGLSHGRRSHGSNRALHCAGFESALDHIHDVVAFAIGVHVNRHIASFFAVGLVISISESGHRHRNIALPSRNARASVDGIAHFPPGRDQNGILRAPEGHVEIRSSRKTVRKLRIPSRALAKIVAVPRLAYRALPGVAELKGLWFARCQWFRQNHRDIVAV